MAPYSLVHIINSEETLEIPNPTQRTPPSDRIKRAALHRFPTAKLSDLAHYRLARTPNAPHESVVGTCRAMRLIAETGKETASRLAALEKAVEDVIQKSSFIRNDLDHTKGRLARTETLATETSRELLEYQRNTVLEERPVVFFGLLCYINTMLVGKESGITDDASTHIDKLRKLVNKRAGLISTNEIVKSYVNKSSVERFTGMIDVRRRHLNSHPNLEPDVLLRKLLLVNRAAHQKGDVVAAEGAHLSIGMFLAVTGGKKARKILEDWKASGTTGWARYVDADLLPYGDLLA